MTIQSNLGQWKSHVQNYDTFFSHMKNELYRSSGFPILPKFIPFGANQSVKYPVKYY